MLSILSFKMRVIFDVNSLNIVTLLIFFGGAATIVSRNHSDDGKCGNHCDYRLFRLRISLRRRRNSILSG